MQKKFWQMAAAAVLLLALTCMTLGCGAKKYKVDYCGSEFAYANAQESYRAGSEVRLVFELIATDTDYRFYLDGEPVDFTYESEGFVITFTMPEHDVVLDYTMVNSMLPPEYCE